MRDLIIRNYKLFLATVKSRPVGVMSREFFSITFAMFSSLKKKMDIMTQPYLLKRAQISSPEERSKFFKEYVSTLTPPFLMLNWVHSEDEPPRSKDPSVARALKSAFYGIYFRNNRMKFPGVNQTADFNETDGYCFNIDVFSRYDVYRGFKRF